jgi:hypothetical protein
MTRRWPGILLGTLCLLALATFASAEGAWVLWNQVTSAAGQEWVLVQAAPTAQQCQASQKAEVQEASKDAISAYGNVVVTKIGDKVTSFRFICVPDTVDPRGPKGK